MAEGWQRQSPLALASRWTEESFSILFYISSLTLPAAPLETVWDFGGIGRTNSIPIHPAIHHWPQAIGVRQVEGNKAIPPANQ